MASREVLVYLFAINHSAAAMKSTNTFCLFSFVPARCHSSPYSPPPRRLATAYTPPISIQTSLLTENHGVTLILNPPYPKRYVGFRPSSFTPFLKVRNIGTRVPSLLA